jgi:hypothetical protein
MLRGGIMTYAKDSTPVLPSSKWMDLLDDDVFEEEEEYF